jgi:phosphoribosylformimino-5-aminoimidazole carboxamide ribotide isomerase
MDLYAAIDLRDGRCVRLLQGDYAVERVYGGDPVAAAKEFEADGASWLHVVDLDAARTGHGRNRGTVASIAQAVHVRVQAGGGIRDEFSAQALLDVGVARIVLGTVAAEQPELLRRLAQRHPGKVVVGVDVRHGEVAIRGWTKGSGLQPRDLLPRLEEAGVAALIVTDVSRDGTLRGPDLSGLEHMLSLTDLPIVASGGVGSLDDLCDLAQLENGGRGLAGVIVGKALWEGIFTVTEAREAVMSCGR